MANEIMKLKQTTVKLPADLHRQLKAYAVSKDMTMQDVIEHLVRELLEKNTSKKTKS